MKLYEIDNEIQKILDNMEIDEETGEAVLDVEALEELQLARQDKLEGIALCIKNLTAEAEAIKAEEDRLEKRRKAIVNRRDGMKDWLLQALNGEKLETARVKVRVAPAVPHAEVDDITDILKWMNDKRDPLLAAYQNGDEAAHQEFKRITELVGYKSVSSVNKAGLKKLIKEFGAIPGVHLEDGKPSLRIV